MKPSIWRYTNSIIGLRLRFKLRVRVKDVVGLRIRIMMSGNSREVVRFRKRLRVMMSRDDSNGAQLKQSEAKKMKDHRTITRGTAIIGP